MSEREMRRQADTFTNLVMERLSSRWRRNDEELASIVAVTNFLLDKVCEHEWAPRRDGRRCVNCPRVEFGEFAEKGDG